MHEILLLLYDSVPYRQMHIRSSMSVLVCGNNKTQTHTDSHKKANNTDMDISMFAESNAQTYIIETNPKAFTHTHIHTRMLCYSKAV